MAIAFFQILSKNCLYNQWFLISLCVFLVSLKNNPRALMKIIHKKYFICLSCWILIKIDRPFLLLVWTLETYNFHLEETVYFCHTFENTIQNLKRIKIKSIKVIIDCDLVFEWMYWCPSEQKSYTFSLHHHHHQHGSSLIMRIIVFGNLKSVWPKSKENGW